MTVQRETLLCGYHYDPLDRLVGCAPRSQEKVQRFYRQSRLVTEIQGQVQHSVFEHEKQILAQQTHEAGKVDCALLATDLQCSVLHTVDVGRHQQTAYSPYGHRSAEGGLISLLGFNGERRDPTTGHYVLGNGYRAFNPVLMRFNSPDSLSPFGKGGVNAYAYCAGDPVNRVDPTGHFFQALTKWGMSQGLLHAAVGRVVSAPAALADRIGSGIRALSARGVDVVNNFRPSYRAIEATKRIDIANEARLASISKYTEIKEHITDTFPFTKTKQYVSNMKAQRKSFGKAKNLSEDQFKRYKAAKRQEGLANQTLQRVVRDSERLQGARIEMDLAVRNWQGETGFGAGDIRGAYALGEQMNLVRR